MALLIKIRSVILDFGGVISLPQKKNFANSVHEILNQKPPDFIEVYGNYRKDYDGGRDSGEEYWSNILRHYGFPVNKQIIEALIVEDIKSWTEINSEMIQFIPDARKRVHSLSIISNMPKDILEHIRNNLQWLDHFDELTFSCEVGIVKPDPGIYEHCLGKIGVPARECLFVDDSIANVDGAKRCGLNAIHFRSFSHFSEEFERKYWFSAV
jgi:putative hydrolase of the HAD superfamily